MVHALIVRLDDDITDRFAPWSQDTHVDLPDEFGDPAEDEPVLNNLQKSPRNRLVVVVAAWSGTRLVDGLADIQLGLRLQPPRHSCARDEVV